VAMLHQSQEVTDSTKLSIQYCIRCDIEGRGGQSSRKGADGAMFIRKHQAYMSLRFPLKCIILLRRIITMFDLSEIPVNVRYSVCTITSPGNLHNQRAVHTYVTCQRTY
jgi:hypothetical protein